MTTDLHTVSLDNLETVDINVFLKQNDTAINEFVRCASDVINKIDELHDTYIISASDEECQNIYEQYCIICSDFSKSFKNVYDTLVKRTVDTYKEIPGIDTRKIISNTVENNRKCMQNLYDKFNKSFDKFNASIKNCHKRRIMTIFNSKISEEKIDKMDFVEMNQICRESIFNNDVLDMVQSLEERHNETIKLEKSIKELYELFKDVAILIDIAQDNLDKTQNHISNAQNYVANSEKHLKNGEKHQRSAHSKQVCICFVVLIVLVIIIFPVIATTKGF